MRLLIATGLYPPDIGGPATYTVFLEKHLPKNGIELDVLPYGSVRKYPRLIRHLIYTAKLILRARSADVLYALDTVSVGLPVRIASFVTRTPYMLRVPGDYAWEQGQQRFGVTQTLDAYTAHPTAGIFVKILAAIQKHVAQHAYHVVVPSDYLKSIVCAWGVASSKITRIYSVLKVIDVSEEREALRTTYGHTSFVITTAGRLVPWKGMHALIRVVKDMVSEGVDVQLEIIGDGTCRKELEELANNIGVAERVRFCGVLERPLMAARIKASDAFVLNTSYEGLSHQLIEVMSIGTPIVTTNVGGNPELIESGKTGTLVEYNDEVALKHALIALRTEPQKGEMCAEAAHAKVQEFHEDRVVQEFVTLMRKLWM